MSALRIATCALLLLGTGVHAQDATTSRISHGRLQLSAGAGAGWARVSCAICREQREPGAAAWISVGTAVRPHVLLALEANGWLDPSDDGSHTALSTGVTATLHPEPHGRLFLSSGISWVRYGAGSGIAANLIGVPLGAGYTMPLTGRLSVSGRVGVVATSFGALRSAQGTVADDVSVSLVQLGIGLTRH